jgi:endonuclease III
MAKPSKDRIVAALLERHGRTYAAELGLDLAQGTPSALYRWLCAATLLSARIGAGIAIAAARALAAQGWTTAAKMAAASWEDRTRTLNRAGYARYDESTARMLGETASMLQRKYRGDLRQLRAAAGHAPERERALLEECKGIGEVGADIFCREAQLAWDELYPFADRRALEAARRLGLEDDATGLARHVSRNEFPRLVAALVRTSLAKDGEDVLEAAADRQPAALAPRGRDAI